MPDLVQGKLMGALSSGVTQHNLDLVNKNFTKLFLRLNAKNFQVSDTVVVDTTVTTAYPALSLVKELQVSLKSTGAPALVFLRQKSTVDTSDISSFGGVSVVAAAVLFISRGDTPIYGTIVGCLDSLGDVHYYPPGSFSAYDDAPPPGINNYSVRAAVYIRTPTQQLRGSVKNDGTILVGSGFTITHSTTGLYVINFTTNFLSTPSVIATCHIGSGSLPFNAQISAVSASSASIITTNAAGQNNETFDFTASGAIALGSIAFSNLELVAQELL